MADAAATLYGLNWCDYRNLVLSIAETDSLLLTKCKREANKPTGKLASLSHGHNESQVLNSLSNLPQQVKGLMELSIFQEHKKLRAHSDWPIQ
ncbi:hypothetical protein H5410_013016, partial [Solanum commersonii]